MCAHARRTSHLIRARSEQNLAPCRGRSQDAVLGRAAAILAIGLRFRLDSPHRRSTAMEYFAGLDVSVRSTSICVVNADGTVVLEKLVAGFDRDWQLGVQRRPYYWRMGRGE